MRKTLIQLVADLIGNYGGLNRRVYSDLPLPSLREEDNQDQLLCRA